MIMRSPAGSYTATCSEREGTLPVTLMNDHAPSGLVVIRLPPVGHGALGGAAWLIAALHRREGSRRNSASQFLRTRRGKCMTASRPPARDRAMDEAMVAKR